MASPPVSGNIGYGMEYDPEKFQAEMAKEKAEEEKAEKAGTNKEDDSDDEEDPELLAKWEAFVQSKNVVKKCKDCDRSPCVLNTGFYEEMMFVGEGMEESGAENKEIRHALYCLAAKKLFGRLGHSVRKRIPYCIMSEIKDAYPNKKGTEYVGFKEAEQED